MANTPDNIAAPALLAAQWHGGSAGNLLAIGVWVLLTGTAVALGRRRRGTERGERLRVLLGAVGIGVCTLSVGWYLMPERFSWDVSLPVQLCDLAGFVAPLALLWRKRPARTLLHFWGFALCTQAFVTPVHAPGTPGFVVSWLLHGVIVGSAVYDGAALGYRPGLRDLWIGIGASTAYAGASFLLNLATGFNYGYTGATAPGTTTIVDALGAWPLRVVWIGLISAAAMVLVLVVGGAAHRAARAVRGRRDDA